MHTQTQCTKNTQLSTQTGNQQQASVLLYKSCSYLRMRNIPRALFFLIFLTDFPEIYSMNSPDKSRPLRNVQRNAEIKSGVHMHNSTFGLVAPQKLRL